MNRPSPLERIDFHIEIKLFVFSDVVLILQPISSHFKTKDDFFFPSDSNSNTKFLFLLFEFQVMQMRKFSNAIIQSVHGPCATHRAVRVKMTAFHVIGHRVPVASSWCVTWASSIAPVTTFLWQQCWTVPPSWMPLSCSSLATNHAHSRKHPSIWPPLKSWNWSIF